MREIEAIITAAQAEYRRFVASGPDRETRTAVGNAVRFLTADLTSVLDLLTATQTRARS
ncbi:hypothetical protein [Prauserella muralis]|nr:hypothetical protein [Prauserella muralis]TWE27390.1 hypothetical protein FHX69_0010 [Prauserella muralis]